MDFIGIILGGFVLDFLGALIRYVYLNIASLIKNNNYISFSMIWSPRGKIDKENENSELNHMIGVIFFGIVIVLLIIFLV